MNILDEKILQVCQKVYITPWRTVEYEDDEIHFVSSSHGRLFVEIHRRGDKVALFFGAMMPGENQAAIPLLKGSYSCDIEDFLEKLELGLTHTRDVTAHIWSAMRDFHLSALREGPHEEPVALTRWQLLMEDEKPS